MILLGSTGSIGNNVLSLAREFKLKIKALACGKNIKLLNKQISEFKPQFICIADEKDKNLVNFDQNKIFCSQEGLEHILELCDDDLIINAIVGFAGLRASIKTKKLNKTLALANKESLVVAGKFLKDAKIIPIDSEHSALKFLIKNQKNINKLYITASGGAFYKSAIKDLNSFSAKDALKHPNWTMGAKITIDSATMANKLFEIIEAYHLFDYKNIDAIIEPSSTIHALCEFRDGGMSAYMSNANMRLAIAQALFKKYNKQIINPIKLNKLNKIKFHKINLKKYPIFGLKDALLKNTDLGVLINAANEVMVKNFLNNTCKFLDISKGIFRTLDHFGDIKIKDINEIFDYDKKVRIYLKEKL